MAFSLPFAVPLNTGWLFKILSTLVGRGAGRFDVKGPLIGPQLPSHGPTKRWCAPPGTPNQHNSLGVLHADLEFAALKRRSILSTAPACRLCSRVGCADGVPACRRVIPDKQKDGSATGLQWLVEVKRVDADCEYRPVRAL